jgi:4-amino-4-deoxy-L-arabinose transferase-like glycosyltransferase
MLASIAALAVCFTAFGWMLLDDQAAFYRELMPGTWLSAAMLLFIAATAFAIHREAGTPGRDFWSLSAVVFVVLAIDELTQPTVFLSKWLKSEHAVSAPAPFNDVDSILLVALLVGSFVLLARHGLGPADVLRELARREGVSGHAEKASRG